MGRNRWQLILQVCVCAWLPVCRTQCPYAECFCSEPTVSCSANNLQVLPPLGNFEEGVHWSLNIYDTNISTITAGSLPPRLAAIDVAGNPITTIDDNAFDDSSSTLSRMTYSKVRFNRLPDAISHLRALTYLSVTDANITDWNDGVWRNIGGSLTFLDLNNVGMAVWPNWIQYCRNLSYINIAYGAISSIPDEALDSVAHSLTSLSLNNNQFTMVPKALSNLNSLQTLYLENNHITDIRWLPQYSKLSTLTLSNNYIWNASQLSEVMLPYSKSLYNFGIDNNRLTIIPNVSFLINMDVLQFTQNRISDPNSGAVPSNIFILDLTYNSLSYIPKILSHLLMLTSIALSNNAIRAIRGTDFHRNTSSLELGFNLITELTDTSFPENFALQDLDLNNNPLIIISSVALQHLPNLSYLDLRYTKLTRLPLGLGYLRLLVTLDISESTQLVCTCMESNLTSWVLKINPVNVRGNCGQTSVYDFFSILSHLCPSSADTHS